MQCSERSVEAPELTSAEEVLLGGGVGEDAGAPSGGAGEVLERGLVGGSVGAVDGAVSGVLTINIDVGGEVDEVLETDDVSGGIVFETAAPVVVEGASDAHAERAAVNVVLGSAAVIGVGLVALLVVVGSFHKTLCCAEGIVFVGVLYSEVEGGVAGLVFGLLVGVDVFHAAKGGHAAGVGAGSDVPDVGLVHALGGLEGGASSGGGGGEEGGGEFHLELDFIYNKNLILKS